MRELLEDLEAFSWKRCGTKLMVYKGNNHFRGNDNADVGLLRPITDFDELTFHYVDCIAVHVDHVKRQSGGAQMQPSSTLSVFQNGSVGHQPLSLIKEVKCTSEKASSRSYYELTIEICLQKKAYEKEKSLQKTRNKAVLVVEF
ncbi:uncharacterized protein LOC116266102 isoform X8 [Nymphaea colorata]|uniref:uncharacterized protein LOC116266102 isoform X8 n=1 Tax=Nymphaea colorata TaxID=210225 RepID=UPI00129E1E71|nr:uncharacterized protein LOC116266102 isoform X8 [Nymphaea colorata]